MGQRDTLRLRPTMAAYAEHTTCSEPVLFWVLTTNIFTASFPYNRLQMQNSSSAEGKPFRRVCCMFAHPQSWVFVAPFMGTHTQPEAESLDKQKGLNPPLRQPLSPSGAFVRPANTEKTRLCWTRCTVNPSDRRQAQQKLYLQHFGRPEK